MSGDTDRAERLERLEGALGHRFGRRALLEQALRHSSFANERALEADADSLATDERESYERLEFLGDSVLALVVAELLFAAKPEWREGELTRALHSIVEGRSLAALAERLGIGPLLRLGRTEQSSGGAEKPSILEDAMEAVVGALYLDGGLPAARRFVEHAFANAFAAGALVVERDPKTDLQERLMSEHGEFPTYSLTADSGVEGDEKRFAVEVCFRGAALGHGIGRTKRAAEKQAALTALTVGVEAVGPVPRDTDESA